MLSGKVKQKPNIMAEFKYKNLSQEEQDKLDAAVFRRLLAQILDENKDVQTLI